MATSILEHSISPIPSNGKEVSSVEQVNTTKRQAIIDACLSQDLHRLRNLASSSHGFLTDDLRRSAWPLLLACKQHGETSPDKDWKELPEHKDEEQVQKDVDRAFVYYPNDEPPAEIKARKKKLFDLIVRVLRTYPMLHYFQGYHDIVQIFLLVCGEKDAFELVVRLSLLHIRDYMLPSLSPATKQLELIPAIIKSSDADLARHLSATPPWFALSSTLTLYAHDVEQYNDVTRIFDLLLAHEPVMALYLFASVILSRRDKLMEIPADDSDMLLFTLSKLPQPLNLDLLVCMALKLYNDYPPLKLKGRAWSSLSQYSVLKTSRAHQPHSEDLLAAEVLFKKHASQIRRQQILEGAKFQLMRQRRPLLTIALTIFVGCISYWLRKSGNDRMLWTSASHLAGILRRLTH